AKMMSEHINLLTFDRLISMSHELVDSIRYRLGVTAFERQVGKRFMDKDGALDFEALKESGYGDEVFALIDQLGAEAEKNALYVTGLGDNNLGVSAGSSDGLITALVAQANGIPLERIISATHLLELQESGQTISGPLIALDDLSYGVQQLAQASH